MAFGNADCKLNFKAKMSLAQVAQCFLEAIRIPVICHVHQDSEAVNDEQRLFGI